jgi:hypothetical protein
MSSVSDFINSGITNGGVRLNRFRVTFSLPSSLAGDTRKLALLTQGAKVPGGNIGTTVVPYMGREVHLPGDLTLDTWDVTVTLNTMEQYHIFKRWQNRIVGTNSNLGTEDLSTIFGSATIELLGIGDSVLDTFSVKLIWPSVVGGLDMSHATNNSIGTIPVTFELNDIDSESEA